MPLIASHDKGSPTPDRAETTDDQLINVITVRKQIPCAVIESVPMIVARVIAVPPNFDIGVLHLLRKQLAFEGAIKVVGHKRSRGL